jgi:DNA-directed RNA polymerase specialized sigma24 family protein
MGKHNNYPGIDPRITRIIAREAERVTYRLGFTESFVQDVEQDLHITISSKLLDPAKDYFEKYVQQIVKHRAADIVRWYQRDCRTAKSEAFSMNASCPESDDPDEQILGIVDLESRSRSSCGVSPSWYEHRDANADISYALAELPDDLRLLADALEASQGNLLEASRLSGLSHKQARIMRDRLQRALKWILEDES